MLTALIVLSAQALASHPLPQDTSADTSRKCNYVIQRASETEATQRPRADDAKLLLLSAVDKRVNNCPVLVMARTGKMIAPPVFTEKPAQLSPAQ